VTALPRNSVGTAQLKTNAVISSKVKDNSITGADVKESSLAQVPSALHANNAASANNAAHANAADSATHATSADSATNATNATNATDASHATSADSATNATNATNATDASHATSADSATNATNATNAGDANTLQSKTPADFVGVSQSAGGALSGPFSNLALRSDVVTGATVANGSLSELDIKDFQVSHTSLTDSTDDSTPRTAQIGLTDDFTIIASCNRSGGSTTGAITIQSAQNNWRVDSNAPGGAVDQTSLNTPDVKNLASFGPTTVAHISSGEWFAGTTLSNAQVSGQVAVSVNVGTAFRCDFSSVRFGTGVH
jgi:hypothetical protein